MGLNYVSQVRMAYWISLPFFLFAIPKRQLPMADVKNRMHFAVEFVITMTNYSVRGVISS